MTDIIVTNHGSIVILTPLTPEGEAWIEANVAVVTQWGHRGIVCEPRYVALILNGAVADGLVIG